jgi:hypothetical protein
MHAVAGSESTSREPGPAGRNRITLATLLAIVAAVAAECALIVQMRRNYAAIRLWSHSLLTSSRCSLSSRRFDFPESSGPGSS